MSRSERDAAMRGPSSRRSATRREWEDETLAPSQDRRPERSVRFSTVSDLPIDRLYTREDLGPDWNEREKLGFPGEYP
jgi:methylmalonyl-CoA mutase N-terminal domain/subunit